MCIKKILQIFVQYFIQISKLHEMVLILQYIKDTLGDVINTILENADDCEVDPAKVTNNSTLISNQENLTMYCDMVWLKIVSSHHYFPR